MPTYEYACTKCGHRFEEFQSIQAEPIRECPQCSGAVERLINGGVGLIFKGSGFYLTDYKNKNTSSADNSGTTKSGGKTETTSDKTEKTDSVTAKD